MKKESRLGSTAPGQGGDNDSENIRDGLGSSQGVDVRSEDSSNVLGAPVEQTTPTKRSRTFDEIRQENRRRLRQKAYDEPATDEGDTWRRGIYIATRCFHIFIIALKMLHAREGLAEYDVIPSRCNPY